ncbi:MAG: DUF3883 domain-containing protein [Pyrinomonadaceae bacterium]
MAVNISAPRRSHMLVVIEKLAQAGWIPILSPDKGQLSRNGQLIVLRTNKYDVRLRLFVYKVTVGSRGKPDERRIEITNTYQKGLRKLRNYQDVVLGYDQGHEIFVGFDPARMDYGGKTGNAASYFDREGLGWNQESEILVRPRVAKLFAKGLEFHAFFKPSRMAEYLLNVEAIHTGSYTGHGLYSNPVTLTNLPPSMTISQEKASGNILILESPQLGPSRRRVSNVVVRAYEKGEVKKLKRAKITPERLLDIKRRCEENGYIGEEFVLNYERRRLRRAGKNDLAAKVQWVSLQSVVEGYDILSYEINGDERWIEVKSTSKRGRTFEMSNNEWRTAMDVGDKYYIYRVTDVLTSPQVKEYRNPYLLESQGLIQKSPSGWWVTLL